MGIVRCIIGNAFCSTTDLQVPSVCTSFVKFGIYWEKNKEDRLVHNHEISVPPRHSVRSTGWPLVFRKITIDIFGDPVKRKYFLELHALPIF